ncbi:hypothetical protein H1C71_017976 [Ictidomys tridecemlineatus]|nr:hypothetical protein H1C71_017976 [Ictidomys tridecemlineatus]
MEQEARGGLWGWGTGLGRVSETGDTWRRLLCVLFHALNQEEQESAVTWGQEGTGGLDGEQWLLDLDLTEGLGNPSSVGQLFIMLGKDISNDTESSLYCHIEAFKHPSP